MSGVGKKPSKPTNVPYGSKARKRVVAANQLREFVVLLFIILCPMVMIPGCAPQNTVTLGDGDKVAIKTTDPLEAFQEEYEAIRQKVEEGSLPAEALRRAAEIRIGLRKYLIKTEAKLEILRLDLLHDDDYEARQTALQEVLALAVERERTKMAYVQRLKALYTTHLPGGKTKKNGKFEDIEIDIRPEDITDGERP